MDHLRHPTQDAQQQIQQALRLCPLFADWPPARVAELAAASRLRRYPRRTLFDVRGSERKDVLVVASGSIEVVTTNASGDKYILAVLGPGQVTKLVLLLERVPMLFGCHAREDAEIVHVPGAVLRQVLDAEPMLWRGLALFMLRRYRRSVEILESQALGSVRRRLAVMLVMLAHRYGAGEAGTCDTELRMSQAELADMLGISRQTVSKELEGLKAEGLLGWSEGYRQISLRDIPGLLRVAENDD